MSQRAQRRAVCGVENEGLATERMGGPEVETGHVLFPGQYLGMGQNPSPMAWSSRHVGDEVRWATRAEKAEVTQRWSRCQERSSQVIPDGDNGRSACGASRAHMPACRCVCSTDRPAVQGAQGQRGTPDRRPCNADQGRRRSGESLTGPVSRYPSRGLDHHVMLHPRAHLPQPKTGLPRSISTLQRRMLGVPKRDISYASRPDTRCRQARGAARGQNPEPGRGFEEIVRSGTRGKDVSGRGEWKRHQSGGVMLQRRAHHAFWC